MKKQSAKEIRLACGQSDFVAVSPDVVGPTGRRPRQVGVVGLKGVKTP